MGTHHICAPYGGAITIKTLLLTLLGLAVCSAGFAQWPGKSKLDTLFDRLAEKNKAMGSLCISRDGSTLYARSIGYSYVNGAYRKPLTATTRLRIGSVSKMFTATMVFQLVEEGKLQLTDTLGRFFPQLPNAGKITILHLLAHRSGMPGIQDGSGRMKPKNHDEILAQMARGTPAFEPGTQYAYSNSGYIVLGYIIEKLTGKSYEEALQEKVAAKAGLKDTHAGTGYTDTSKNEGFSYQYLGDWQQQKETHLSIPGGAGAVLSTAADLARFINALFSLQLVSNESLRQMKENELGMATFTYNNKTFYGHTGGIDNFGAWLMYQPEEKLAVAYTTNAKVYPVGNIIDGITSIYYDQPFTVPAFETVAVSTDLLDKYTGVYANPEAPAKFTVTRDGGKLLIQLPDKSVVPLDPLSQNRFKAGSFPLEFRFDAGKNEMTIIRDGRERVFTKEKI